MKPQIAFGLAKDGFVFPSTIESYARDARIKAGKMWADDDEDWRGGWKRAVQDGFRVVKVRVSIIERGAA